jgi:hypothetical protein
MPFQSIYTDGTGLIGVTPFLTKDGRRRTAAERRTDLINSLQSMDLSHRYDQLRAMAILDECLEWKETLTDEQIEIMRKTSEEIKLITDEQKELKEMIENQEDSSWRDELMEVIMTPR